MFHTKDVSIKNILRFNPCNALPRNGILIKKNTISWYSSNDEVVDKNHVLKF